MGRDAAEKLQVQECRHSGRACLEAMGTLLPAKPVQGGIQTTVQIQGPQISLRGAGRWQDLLSHCKGAGQKG